MFAVIGALLHIFPLFADKLVTYTAHRDDKLRIVCTLLQFRTQAADIDIYNIAISSIIVPDLGEYLSAPYGITTFNSPGCSSICCTRMLWLFRLPFFLTRRITACTRATISG